METAASYAMNSISQKRLPSVPATFETFPSRAFSPPSHAASLYPVTTIDSSEFLPPPILYSSSYNKNQHSQSLVGHRTQTHPESTSSFSFRNPNDHIIENMKNPLSYTQTQSKPANPFQATQHTSGRSFDPRVHQIHKANLQYFRNSKSGKDIITDHETTKKHSQVSHETAKRPLEVSSVRFQCKGRSGYYGDQDFDCQVFHFCSHDGKRFTFRCGKGLTFNEVSMINNIFNRIIIN